MGTSLPEAELAALRSRLAETLRQGRDPAAAGYQGQIHVVETAEHRLVVKEALGWGPALWIRRWMLRRENEIYERLTDFASAPRCYGLLDGRFLILELVEGVPFRRAEFRDRDGYFTLFLEAIRELHRRGVAHGDLKRKENLLVIDGSRPCLLDFGAAILEPSGFSPLRRRLYETLRQYDLNAWAKLKSNRRLETLSESERELYRRGPSERVARWIKGIWLRLRWGKSGPPPRA